MQLDIDLTSRGTLASPEATTGLARARQLACTAAGLAHAVPHQLASIRDACIAGFMLCILVLAAIHLRTPGR